MSHGSLQSLSVTEAPRIEGHSVLMAYTHRWLA